MVLGERWRWRTIITQQQKKQSLEWLRTLYHGRGKHLLLLLCIFIIQSSIFVQGLNYLRENEKSYLHKLLPHVVIFARCAPKQKEYIITTLQELGYNTLMCGDGTNDVGALKHAQVGVAILASPPKRESMSKNSPIANESALEPAPPNGPRSISRQQQIQNSRTKIEKILKDIEEQEMSCMVKLGDASIAAPFTSRFSSIQCSNFWFFKYFFPVCFTRNEHFKNTIFQTVKKTDYFNVSRSFWSEILWNLSQKYWKGSENFIFRFVMVIFLFQFVTSSSRAVALWLPLFRCSKFWLWMHWFWPTVNPSFTWTV